ncbi:MAG: hypothetical protein ACWA42_07850 [Lutibacter sp.]
MIKKFLITITFFTTVFCFAQENLIKVSVDTTSIRIGEQIQYKITAPKNQQVLFPKLVLDSLHKVEVVSSFPPDTLKNKIEKKYILTSFDSGNYVIPSQKILLNNKSFQSDSLLIKVATVKVDTTKQKMFPIKAVKQEPKTFDDYLQWWWIVLLILLILGVILYFVFRKKEVKKEIRIEIPPIEEALQRLKALDDKQLLKQDKIKLYYTELTDIVRNYIEKAIQIPAMESTTDELLTTINDFNQSSNLGISKETINQLKEVLTNADLVKFAKSKPIIDEIKSHRVTSENIVQNLNLPKKEDNELE